MPSVATSSTESSSSVDASNVATPLPSNLKSHIVSPVFTNSTSRTCSSFPCTVASPNQYQSRRLVGAGDLDERLRRLGRAARVRRDRAIVVDVDRIVDERRVQRPAVRLVHLAEEGVGVDPRDAAVREFDAVRGVRARPPACGVAVLAEAVAQLRVDASPRCRRRSAPPPRTAARMTPRGRLRRPPTRSRSVRIGPEFVEACYVLLPGSIAGRGTGCGTRPRSC